MSMARATSQRHTEHGHHKLIAILDGSTACFHTDMDELIHGHPPRETEPECIVVWLFEAHIGPRRVARLWQDFFGNEVFMSAGWNAEALEPNAYRKAEDLNGDDDASTFGHSDSFMVELRIEVVQDVKAMKEHKVDIEVSTIIGTEAKIVKQVSSWRQAGITWVRLESRAAVLGQRGTRRMSYLVIVQRRDHWLVALRSVSYSMCGTLSITSKS